MSINDLGNVDLGLKLSLALMLRMLQG